MKIIIVGCGKIGKTILESLVKEKHDVLAIDVDPSVVGDIRNTYDVMALDGSGTEYDTLKRAGVEEAELFISVTSSDESNMLACFIAKRMGAKYTVARIRDLENNDESLRFLQDQLDIDMAINPERLAAEAIYRILKLPSAAMVETFSSRRIEMIELMLKPDSPIDGMTLMDLRKEYNEKFLICVVRRDDKVYIPNGSFALRSGDRIGLIVSYRDAHKLLEIMGASHVQVKDVMIMGAGIVSNYLARMLVSARNNVKIIDIDPSVCEEVCENLPDKVTVICGDGMDQNLLIEEGILSTDAFVALTGKDENNILISFFALSKDVPKVISKVNRDELLGIADKLGLECMISPRKIVADVIVKYARSLDSSKDSHIETLYSFMSGMAEALEFKVLEDFDYTGIPLKELKLRNNVLLAGIIRRKQAIIPSGDDVILEGDNVIVIAQGDRLLSLSEIIER